MLNNREIYPSFVTYQQYLLALTLNPYYKARWQYFQEVVEILQKHNASGKILELGCYQLPLINNSDTWDKNTECNTTFIDDATKLPWRFENKSYDWFISLQTFEHLSNKQTECFEEAKRIAKNICISLPYQWQSDDAYHRDIDDSVIAKWTNNLKITYQKISGTQRHSKRIILLWCNIE